MVLPALQKEIAAQPFLLPHLLQHGASLAVIFAPQEKRSHFCCHNTSAVTFLPSIKWEKSCIVTKLLNEAGISATTVVRKTSNLQP
jgi:hypothetical protein